MWSPRRCRRAAGFALVLLLTGCADGRDGVTVKALSADLSFGADAPGAEGTGAAGSFSSSGGSTSPTTPEGLALYDPDPLGPQRPGGGGAPVALGPCPQPSQSAVSTTAATPTVQGTPVPGLYRWRQSGSVEITGFARLPLSPTTFRTIAAVSTSGGITSYRFDQPGLAGAERHTIEIRPDGVYLTRLVVTGGGQDLDFQPVPLLAPKLYSLPIRPGEVVSAQVPDLAHGLVLTLTGTVGTRERLEGCGVVFDGWAFRGQRALEVVGDATRSVRSTTYNTWLATQLGGIVIGQEAVTRGQIGGFVYSTEYVATLGDRTPVREA